MFLNIKVYYINFIFKAYSIFITTTLSQEILSTGISNFFNEFFTSLYFFGFLTTQHAKKHGKTIKWL